MSPLRRDAMLGLTAIITLVALAAILMLFGELSLRKTWQLTVLAPHTAGIGQGSLVSLNGVPVGTVDHIETINDGPWQVRIIAHLHDGVLVSTTVEPLVTAKLLGGNAGLYLETSPGGSGHLPTDGSAILEAELISMTQRDLEAAIDERIGPVLTTINSVAGTWTAVGVGLNQWLSDPELKASTKDVLHLAVASLDRTVETMERFATLASNVDQRAGELSAEAMTAARQLTEMLHTSSQLIEDLRSGEGTAGQLVSNPDLYNSLESTAKELDRLSRAMRLLVEQVREEGLGPMLSP